MKFHGTIGFSEDENVKPNNDGFVRPNIREVEVGGDLLSFRRRNEYDGTNPNGVMANTVVSIVANASTRMNVSSVRFIRLQVKGTPWTVTNFEIDGNRIKLTLGGVWRGSVGS